MLDQLIDPAQAVAGNPVEDAPAALLQAAGGEQVIPQAARLLRLGRRCRTDLALDSLGQSLQIFTSRGSLLCELLARWWMPVVPL